MISNLLNMWSSNSAGALVAWGVTVMVILYLGRKQAHQVLYGSGRGLYRIMRLWSYSISQLEQQFIDRNNTLLESKPFASSIFTQCVVSGLVLVAGLLAAFVNFRLISVPMAGVVGDVSDIAGLALSDLTALVFILVEVVVGLLFTESVGLTHLFPRVEALQGRVRKLMAFGSLGILILLACGEASLFQSRYMLVLAFTLPFVLALIAIPFESFMYSLRVAIGGFCISALRIFRVAVRMVGGLFNNAFMVLRHGYDLIIVIPLGVERLVRSYMDREVEIDVPMLTRVEAEALKSGYGKNKRPLVDATREKPMTSKATFKSVPSTAERKRSGSKTVIEDSSIVHVNLAETMMSSSVR